MTNTYLDWVEDEILIAAVQYLGDRVQNEMNYNMNLNPMVKVAQQELLPAIDYGQAIALDRLERSMPMFHRMILSSLPDLTVGNLDGSHYDVMRIDETQYIEFQTYFRYKMGTTYIDRLATHASTYPSRTFYLCFVNGSYNNDTLPALDRIELSYPELENFRIVELTDLYAELTGEAVALQQLIDVLPRVFRNVVSVSTPHVFVSYSRRNTADMKQVVASLNEFGIKTWTDEALQPGTPDWQIAIEDALENAACVLLILSPDAKQSKWVRNELNYARESGQAIIPFWIQGESHEVSMLNLITAQRVDAREPTHYDAAIQDTIQSIERFIQQKLV